MIQEKQYIIRIVSPVHIGCDEVYEPAGFIIEEKKHLLRSFNPIDFVRSLDQQDKDRLSAICEQGSVESILELYTFMQGRSFPGREVNICAGFIDSYQKTLSISTRDRRRIQQELNNFSISRTAYNPRTQRPYIPGSAIKGALRTAYLNGMQSEKNLPQGRNANHLERDLLDGGAFQTDPLRLLKVSDFHPVGNCRTKILYAVNEKKKPSKFKARGPYQVVEIIEPGTVFVGTITVVPPLPRSGITTPLTETSVFSSAKTFYQKERTREATELSAAGLATLKKFDLNGDVPLRIGRHSGAESLTIEGQRQVRIMKKRGEQPGHESGATTFWLAADKSSGYNSASLAPFGWVAIVEATEAMLIEQENVLPQEIEESQEGAAPETERRTDSVDAKEKTRTIEKTGREKLIEELALVNSTDMGRIGTIIQGIEALENDEDKAAVARAIRDKIGAKAFKKHKRKEYLSSLIGEKE